MPIYEYQCQQCGTISEFLIGIGTFNNARLCKQCGSSQLEKIISVPHSLKGDKRAHGQTCCGKEERCSTSPCSNGGTCRQD